MEPSINGHKIKILGDPHLGKKFVNGVPLERRGEREQSQWSDFHESLTNCGDVDVHVCMGDIFDKFNVDSNTLLDAALEYKDAARKHPNTTFIVLRGNHDAARDIDKVSSFVLLKWLVESTTDNVTVVDEPQTFENKDGSLRLGFVPWDPIASAKELVSELDGSFDAVFGHWDMDDYGDGNPNLIPVEELEKITDLVYTGHVHTPETRQYGDLTVYVTGSMQPYTHGEDPNNERYVTLTPEEAEQRDDLKDKCVRILLGPDDEMPDIDCLQLTAKKAEITEPEEGEDLSIENEGLDFKSLMGHVFAEHQIESDTVSKVEAIIEELRESE